MRQLATTPGSALRRHLLGEHAEWGPHEENTARLLEVQAYQLDLDWIRTTTDPDDHQLLRERLDAKRRGIKPPKRPIIPPVAQRPPTLAAQHAQAYADQLAAHANQGRVTEQVTTDEFDEALDLS